MQMQETPVGEVGAPDCGPYVGGACKEPQCARTWFGAPSFIFPENATFVLAHVQSRLEALGSLRSGLTKAFECPCADSATLVSSIPGPGLSPV